MPGRRGSLTKSFLGLVVVGALFYAVVVLLDPWALHISGRWTPMLMWQGTGKLHTKSGGAVEVESAPGRGLV